MRRAISPSGRSSTRSDSVRADARRGRSCSSDSVSSPRTCSTTTTTATSKASSCWRSVTSPANAQSLVAGTGKSFDDLARSADTPRGFTPVALPGVRLELRTAVDRHIVPDRNVVALLEGAEPRLKDEWVIVSAHFDHNGADATQIFNGADDNGSGTVALIEIAEAYALAAKDGQRPKRSVLFAAWNSEERGLLGAWAYTEQPLAPLSNVAAVLNMDMVGRNEEVPVGGGPRFNGLEVQTAESNANAVNVMGFSRAPSVASVVDRANAAIGLELKKRYDNNASQLVRRSDQWPFLQSGVPALGFMTGLHPDYHTQYDRPEKINYAKARKDRTAHPPGELTHCERRPAAEFEVIDAEACHRRARDRALLLARRGARRPPARRAARGRAERPSVRRGRPVRKADRHRRFR